MKKPPSLVALINSADTDLQYIESYIATEDDAQAPYHGWDTRAEPFSTTICEKMDIIIPGIGLPHPTTPV